MRLVLLAAMMLAAIGSAQAQGIDCSKARTPIERTMCNSPTLVALDRQVGAAYAATVAQRPDQANSLRQEQLRWLRARDAACALPAAQLASCLSEQMTARLAQLAPAEAPPPRPAPVAAQPPPPSVVPRREVGVPSAANPAPPAATIEPAAFQAAEQVDATLQVTSPGRFTIRAQSATGVALQLVDMLTGPADPVGEPGVRDGRIEALLDVGVYRVRAFAAKGATDSVRLVLTPFRDAAPPRALPQPDEMVTAELRDGEQRGFWLVVPPSGMVEIEAAGRALADLRLWRAGRELSALAPATHTIEPSPGRTLLDLRLSGKVEPGVYLVIAYGGPALPWAEGGDAAPFHLRAGLREDLAEGWAGGAIGPFGSERFAAPAFAGVFRLRLARPAPAALRVDGQSASIARDSREPSATVRSTPGQTNVVEVSGAAGQGYVLRASEPAARTTLTRAGTYWVSADALGAGGDEAPPTVLLERFEGRTPPRIVAGNLPRLGPRASWHARFNLRGPTALLFENQAGGPVNLRTSGIALAGDPGDLARYDLPADYFVLRLRPAPGAQGAVEVALGPPDAAPALAPPLPPDPVIPLGIQTVEPGQSLALLAQTAPGAETGLSARPVPVALVEGPLSVTQPAGSAAVAVPVALAAGGHLSAREVGGADVAVADEPGPNGAHRVTIPAADSPRTVVLAWRRDLAPPPDIPAPPPPDRVPAVQAGQPVPFDLAAAGETRGFALDVGEGGLYRIETLGRLRTAGRVATAFIPELDTAEANGVGENFLIQRWLRAGRYRVDITAQSSFGHTALRAAPAPLLRGATLEPGGSVRATMPAGSGAAFPLRIEQEGRYRLELASLGAPFTARLEDAEGWPITRPGPLTILEESFRPSVYRLVVSPEAVTRRAVARLDPIRPEPRFEGHGPHTPPLGTQVSATWREPAGRDDPRTPDTWTFRLAGPAQVSLAIGDGMLGELWAEGAGRALARITRDWTGHLDAGAYRITAVSLGRNDRLDYTLLLSAREMQPGEVRALTLPATVPFAIAERRVVSFTSWGTVPVRAVLRREDGSEVARTGPRQDDWNIALSRPLDPGTYRLELATSLPPSGTAATPQDTAAAEVTEPEPNANDDEQAATDDQEAQSARERQAPASAESGEQPEQKVELRFSLPAMLGAAEDAQGEWTGDVVHLLSVPNAAPGQLVIARAESEGTVALALERQTGAGWQVVATDASRRPLVAAPADADASAWRVAAWPLDGGAAPIRAAARSLDDAAQAPGPITLHAVEGLGVAASRVALPTPGVLEIDGAPSVAGWPGHAAEPIETGHALAQANEVWLLADGPGEARVRLVQFDPAAELVVPIPAGGVATLPAVPAPQGRARFWLAASAIAQPAPVGPPLPTGLAEGSVLAAAGALRIRNASERAMPLRVRLLDVALVAPAEAGALTLPPLSAMPVNATAERYQVTLTAGTAAVTRSAIAWAGDAALTRTVQPSGALVLLNTTSSPQSGAVRQIDAPMPAGLHVGDVFKRFFGASGSFELPVSGAAGARLAVAGENELLWAGEDGQIRRGRAVSAEGPGRVVVTHGVGALVLSLAAPGASPWSAPAPEAITLPHTVALTGPAMAYSFKAETPVLLHATTTAPVLIGLGNSPPELFASGAEFHRALPSGAAIVRLYPPQDGPLTGTLALSAEPIRPIGEGLGDTVAVAPGETASFGFRIARRGMVGLGVRAEPNGAELRLLNRRGAVLGEGLAQLVTLDAGQYVMEVRVPPDAPPTLIRPAVVGITPPGNGPPPEIVQQYLELVGMKPGEQAR